MGIIWALVLSLFLIGGIIVLFRYKTRYIILSVFKWAVILLFFSILCKAWYDYYEEWKTSSKGNWIEVEEDLSKSENNPVDTETVSSPVQHSIWVVKNFIDEFREPTDAKYITNSSRINGTFSSSVGEYPLSVEFIILDEGSISFRLYRQGTLYKRKGKVEYSVLVKDKNGDRETLSAIQDGDRVTFSQTDGGKYSSADFMFSILSRGGEIKFHMKPVDADSEWEYDEYNFKIENADYLDEALQKLGL